MDSGSDSPQNLHIDFVLLWNIWAGLMPPERSEMKLVTR